MTATSVGRVGFHRKVCRANITKGSRTDKLSVNSANGSGIAVQAFFEGYVTLDKTENS